MATIATLKGTNKKSGPEKVFKLVRDSLETSLARENFNACLGEMISNKSVKQNTINNSAGLRMTKDKINHDYSNDNDDNASHDNTICHYHTCVLKEDFNSYQVKYTKSYKC